MQRGQKTSQQGVLRAPRTQAVLRLLFIKAPDPQGGLCHKPTSQGRNKQDAKQASQRGSLAEQKCPGMLESQLGQALPARPEHAASREKLVWGNPACVRWIQSRRSFLSTSLFRGPEMGRKQGQHRDPGPAELSALRKQSGQGQ